MRSYSYIDLNAMQVNDGTMLKVPGLNLWHETWRGIIGLGNPIFSHRRMRVTTYAYLERNKSGVASTHNGPHSLLISPASVQVGIHVSVCSVQSYCF
jgi:hypothetical protein